jgi:hypothetical protein
LQLSEVAGNPAMAFQRSQRRSDHPFVPKKDAECHFGHTSSARRPGRLEISLLEMACRENALGEQSEHWLAFDGCLVHQHDGNVVFHRIYPVTLRALQALRVLPVVEGLLARGTNQNIQQVFGNHDKSIVRQEQWSVVGGRWSVRSLHVRSFQEPFRMFSAPSQNRSRPLTTGH